MFGIVDNVVCVKCGCVMEFSHNNRTLLGRYMCYRCHRAKIDICESGLDAQAIIKSIEAVNQCRITDYYIPRNRISASK